MRRWRASFATLKKDLLRGATFATRRQARAAIFDYIEDFYSRRRLHSGLGYPAQSSSNCRPRLRSDTCPLGWRVFHTCRRNVVKRFR